MPKIDSLANNPCHLLALALVLGESDGIVEGSGFSPVLLVTLLGDNCILSLVTISGTENPKANVPVTPPASLRRTPTAYPPKNTRQPAIISQSTEGNPTFSLTRPECLRECLLTRFKGSLEKMTLSSPTPRLTINEDWFLVMAHKRSELTLAFDIVGNVCVGRGARDLLYLLVTVFNYLKFCFSFQEPEILYFHKFHKSRTKETGNVQMRD